MSESLGALIGQSNVVTWARSRIPAGADPDADPGQPRELARKIAYR